MTSQLNELRGETDVQLRRNQAVLARIEPLEASLNKLRSHLEVSAKCATAAELAAQKATHDEAVAQTELQRLTTAVAELHSQFGTILETLNLELQPYGMSAESANAANQDLLALEARRDQWTARQERLTELERNSAALQASLDALAMQLEHTQQALADGRTAHQLLLDEKQQLSEQRFRLYSDRSPSEEKRRLEKAVQAAEHARELAQTQHFQAQQQLTLMQTRIHELSTSVAALTQRHDDDAKSFVRRLSQSGFASEDAYLAARLSESQRASLNQQAQNLTNEQTVLSTSMRDTSEQLKAQRARQITTESADSLQRTEQRLGEELKSLRDDASRMRGQLDAQRQLKGRQQQSLLALETQRCVCERWDKLHQLIGSADGKKFRNFAQGLTFERMIALANLQLRKLTDRYLLFHDNTQPLELQVVDSYQADQVRSTRNLSGGESFLVSLALALGLSHMASRNVRVDSLFLDEGFGSLDEDTLQTALDTLSSLQQEGKVIGVISHVPALKEQIRTQIQVKPQTEGRSTLAGPGCKLL